jgi:TonB-linked SusC/RagA family outer membrane protein
MYIYHSRELLCLKKTNMKKLTNKKIIIICLLLFSLITSAQNISDIKVSLNFQNTELSKIFKSITEQTNYGFSYLEENINSATQKTIICENRDLNSVLVELLGTDLTWKLNKNTVVIKKRVKVSSKLVGQIIDAAGMGIPGVNVIVKGTTNGTVTDVDGKFELSVLDADNQIIVFSSIGFEKIERKVGLQREFNITLNESSEQLDEVVVVGYGIQKKVNLTGAVDVISTKSLKNRQAPSVSQLLQGAAPGLTFSVGNFGFQPGATMDIKIRGTGTINGGGSPYVLVDGVPGNMNRLNPEDIESVSILKDAAASAIYGARAPYGVVLITTKSSKTKEEFKATYSTSLSVAKPQNLPSMLNSYTHAKAINEAGVAGAGGRFFPNDIIDNIVAYQDGDYEFIKSRPNFPQDATHFETTPRAGGNSWGFNQFGNANRDWFDEYFDKGYIQKHDVSISGGTNKTSYYLSGGFYDQSGVLAYGTDTYERYNVLGKIKTQIYDFWDFTYKPRFSKTVREIPNMDKQGSYDLIFHQIARTMPSNAKYDGYGNHMIQSKIPWVNDAGTDVTETLENWQSFDTEIRPVEGWKINADFSYRNTAQTYQSKELTVYDNLVDKRQVPSGNTVPSQIISYQSNNQYWTTNLYTSYEIKLSDHFLKVMTGAQFEETDYKKLRAERTNLLVPDVPSISTADGEIKATENLQTYSTQGYFGRFNYNYAEKYLLEVNARYDGTSRFKEDDQWGFFPSFSAGWNIDREFFWKPIKDIVNTFKIRGSWGELGNQNVALYQGLELIPMSGGSVNWIFEPNGTRPVGYAGTPSLVSQNLTWETVTTINIGTNMTFLDGRLGVDFDWFIRETSDMIGPVPGEPGVIGTGIPRTNNATLESKGWEFNINWRDSFKNGFSYYVGLNIYDSKAKVTEYLNPTGILSDWYEGREVGEIWGYTSNGLYKTQEEITEYTSAVDLSDLTGLPWNTGDVKYEDVNGDGFVDNGSNTVSDHGDLKKIGNSTPRYQYGISLGASYEGIDFSMVWKGVGERDLWFGGNDNMFWGFRTGNQSSLFPDHLDYFRDQPGDTYTGIKEGDANINLNAYYPRPYINNGHNNKNRKVTTRYLQDGSYLRLQNLQIGYSLPKTLLDKLYINKFRISITGENLLTITDLPDGIDPVAVSGGFGAGKTYGPDRVFSIGFQITY